MKKINNFIMISEKEIIINCIDKYFVIDSLYKIIGELYSSNIFDKLDIFLLEDDILKGVKNGFRYKRK